MNELYEHKRSDTLKWILTLIAFILVGVLFAGIICGWFDKQEEAPDTEQTEQTSVIDGDGNVMNSDTVYSMPSAMTFSAAALASVTSSQSVDVRIEAYVYPENAANREVDYTVAWGNAPSHGSEPVSNYLTLTPDSNGSRLATVSCKKGFDDDTIIITVITRDGGHTATCTVTFEGIATDISVSSSTATRKSNSSRGTYYEVSTNKTYTFNISLSNSLNDASGSLSVSDVGGYGSLYFGNGSFNDGGYINYTDMYLKDIDEIADKFITSATISGNTLTIKTGTRELESYYAHIESDDLFIADILYDRYVVEITDDLSSYKGEGDTFYNSKAEYNVETSPSCYLYVTVKDSVSGLEETIKLWIVSSVRNVTLVSSLTF